MRVLQRHFSREISRCDPEAPYIKEFLSSLSAIVHSVVRKTASASACMGYEDCSVGLFLKLAEAPTLQSCDAVNSLVKHCIE